MATPAAALALLLLVPLLLLLLLRRRRSRLPPGPLAMPIFGNWLQVGNDLNHRFLASLAGKYGPVFLLKLGLRNLVVVSDPKLASEVLHTQGVEFGSRPRNVVFDIFTGNGQDMVFTIYGDHWRKMRRIMTLPFFTNKVVQQYRDMWSREMDLVVRDLHSSPPEGLLVRRRLQLMLYNVMFGIMFDTRFESMDDPLFKEATVFNRERSRLAQSFEYNYGDFIPFLRPFLRGYLNKCRDLQSRRLKFFDTHFVQHRRRVLAETPEKERKKEKLSCAMDYIIEAERTGEISPENVLYIVENINVAAIETTLWSMEWAIAELVNHRRVQEKVREELTRVLGHGQGPREEDLARLPYLQAVVKEALRLHTPIPLLVPHMNLEEATLGGYTIPRESKVVVNAWWLANNPEWWRDPEQFRPERFFEEEYGLDAATTGKVDYRYLPFGVGRRSCPGIILALPLLGMVVGKLVAGFDMVPPPGVDKLDLAEEGGQFSLHLAQYSTIAFKPLH